MWTINVEDDKNLILLRSGESLSFIDFQNILSQMRLENKGKYASYNRFVDFSILREVNTNYDSIRDLIQKYREVNPIEDHVKIAIYPPSGFLRPIIEFYVQEKELNTAKYLVSSSLQECADFLSVGTASLQD